MRLLRLVVLLLPLSLTSADILFAQNDDVYRHPEEIVQGDMVYPQEPGELQITLAPSFAAGEESREARLPVIVEYGLTDALQIEAG